MTEARKFWRVNKTVQDSYYVVSKYKFIDFEPFALDVYLPMIELEKQRVPRFRFGNLNFCTMVT